VISGVDGVEVQTEIMWERAADIGAPSIIFISKLDRERAGFERTMDDIKETLAATWSRSAFLSVRNTLSGVIDLISGKAFEPDGPGKSKEIPVPDDLAGALEEGRDKLAEAVAETDDALLEKYLEEGELTAEEIAQGMKKGVLERTLIPVLCGAASKGIGIPELLDFIANVLPLPQSSPIWWAPCLVKTKRSRSPGARTPRCVRWSLKHWRIPTWESSPTSGSFPASFKRFHRSQLHPRQNERVGQLFRVTGKEQAPCHSFRPVRSARWPS